jgi:hypothetical protein
MAFAEYHHVRLKTSPSDHFWHNPWLRTSLFCCCQPPQKDEVTLDFGSDKCLFFS